MKILIARTEECAKALEKKWARAAPIIYILLGTFLISIISLLGKALKMNANEIVYGRGIVMCILGTMISQSSNISLYGFSREVNKKLFMRSIVGCFATMFFYTGLNYVNIAEAQVLLQTSPFWTALIAIYILKTETFSRSLFINLIFCFIGILFITQPPFIRKIFHYNIAADTQNSGFFGYSILLISAVFFSIVQVLINSLSNKVNQLVIPQYFAITSMIISALSCVVEPTLIWRIPNYWELFLLVSVGVIALLQQILVNRAYMKGDLTQISMLGQTQILGASISLLSVAGSILIVGALFKVIIDKKRKNYYQK